MGDPRQARENRAYVRRLLREKQPGFAAALEAVALEWAARDLSGRPGREPASPGRVGTVAAAVIDTGPQLPGIDRLRAAGAPVIAARAGMQ